MTDQPPDPESGYKGAEHAVDRPPATPRWVKVFGIIVVILVLLLVILLLTGGPGRHGPGRHMGLGEVAAGHRPSNVTKADPGRHTLSVRYP